MSLCRDSEHLNECETELHRALVLKLFVGTSFRESGMRSFVFHIPCSFFVWIFGILQGVADEMSGCALPSKYHFHRFFLHRVSKEKGSIFSSRSSKGFFFGEGCYFSVVPCSSCVLVFDLHRVFSEPLIIWKGIIERIKVKNCPG